MHKVSIIPCLLGGVPCFCCIFSFYSHLCVDTQTCMWENGQYYLLTIKATACLQNFIGTHPMSFIFPSLISSWKWYGRDYKICFVFFKVQVVGLKGHYDNILHISTNAWLGNNNDQFIIKACAILNGNTYIMEYVHTPLISLWYVISFTRTLRYDEYITKHILPLFTLCT